MDQNNSLPPRGRSRGRGEKKSTVETPITPQSPVTAEGSDGNWQGGRGRARGRGIRKDSPAAAGRALLRVPLTVQPGQESVAAVSSTLASTHIATEGESGAGAISIPRPPIVQRAILKTKPDSVDSKKGSSGRSVEIATNYFKLFGKPDWRLLQYRVDFKPEEDNTAVRKSIVRDLKDRLGKYTFDGSLLFTTARLTPNKNTPLILHAVRKTDNCTVEATFKLVGEVEPTEHHYLQFFNIVLRQCLEKLNLQLLGRNYYDPGAARILRDFKLELWPGYITSISVPCWNQSHPPDDGPRG